MPVAGMVDTSLKGGKMNCILGEKTEFGIASLLNNRRSGDTSEKLKHTH